VLARRGRRVEGSDAEDRTVESWKAFSKRMAAISPEMPPVLVSSWTTRHLLVLRTD